MNKSIAVFLLILLMGTAAEAAVTKVEFYRDNSVLIGTDTTAPYSLQFDTSTLPAGSHTFYAKAYDDASLTSTSAISTVTVNSTSGPLPGTDFWAKDLGGETLNDVVNPKSVITDAAGNSFVTGNYEISVGDGTSQITRVGGYDIYIAKYSSSGQLLWLKSMGGANDDFGTGVAVDSLGNIYVSGYFSGSMTIAGTTLTSAGGSDIFVVKMDANGVPVPGMARRYGGTGTDQGTSVKIWKDSSGEYLILGGRYTGTVTVEGVSLTAAGSSDIVIGKFMISGGGFSPVWVKTFGNATAEKLVQLAIDGSGNIFGITEFSGTINYGRGDHVSAGGNDVGVIKLDPSGTVQISKSFGGVPSDIAYSIAASQAGHFAICVAFTGVMDIGGQVFTNEGSADGLVAVFDPSGNAIWAKSTNSSLPLGDTINGVVLDNNGQAYITGSFVAAVDFGGGWLDSSGTIDVIAAKFDANGNHVWSKRYPNSSNERSTAITLASDGNIIITGYFEEYMKFVNNELASLTGKDDAFVVKLKS